MIAITSCLGIWTATLSCFAQEKKDGKPIVLGDVVTLEMGNKKSEIVVVAYTKEGVLDFEKRLKSGDKDGVIELVLKMKITNIKSGSKALVTDIDKQSGHLRVRIREGEEKGKEFWVLSSFASK